MISKKLLIAGIAALVLVTGCSKEEDGDDRSVAFVVDNSFPNGMWDIVDHRFGFTSTNGVWLVTPNAMLSFYDERTIPNDCGLDFETFRASEVAGDTPDALERRFTGWRSNADAEPNTRIFLQPLTNGEMEISFVTESGAVNGYAKLKNRRDYSEADLHALRARTCTPQYGWDFG